MNDNFFLQIAINYSSKTISVLQARTMCSSACPPELESHSATNCRQSWLRERLPWWSAHSLPSSRIRWITWRKSKLMLVPSTAKLAVVKGSEFSRIWDLASPIVSFSTSHLNKPALELSRYGNVFYLYLALDSFPYSLVVVNIN